MVGATIRCTSPQLPQFGTKLGCQLCPFALVLVKDPKGKFETQALLCTDLTATPVQILQWFRWRWQMEVTFEEARAHLGVESQRQWSSQAIARTTPALLALFSIVTVVAHQQLLQHPFELPKAAWYRKTLPTFADAKRVCQTTTLANADFSDVKYRCRHS